MANSRKPKPAVQIYHSDWQWFKRMLTHEQKGRLMDELIQYSIDLSEAIFEDENTETDEITDKYRLALSDDTAISGAFMVMAMKINADTMSYQKRCNSNSNNAKGSDRQQSPVTVSDRQRPLTIEGKSNSSNKENGKEKSSCSYEDKIEDQYSEEERGSEPTTTTTIQTFINEHEGFERNVTENLEAWVKEYGIDETFAAIRQAYDGGEGKCNAAYIKATLEGRRKDRITVEEEKSTLRRGMEDWDNE